MCRRVAYLHAQDNKEIDIGNPPELLKQIFGQKGYQRISGGLNPIIWWKSFIVVAFRVVDVNAV